MVDKKSQSCMLYTNLFVTQNFIVMSGRKKGLEKFGSLCRQLIRMCQNSRNDRAAQQRTVRSVKATSDESLTDLIGASSTIGEHEQNPHESFYRQHYED